MIKFKNLCIFVIVIVLLFQEQLMNRISLMTYLDEIIAIFFLTYYIVRISRKKKILKCEFKMIISMIIVILVGVIGNIIYKYQTNYIPIVRDIFNYIKVFAVFLGSYYYMNDRKIDRKWVVINLSKVVKIIVSIAFICALLNLRYDFGMSGGEIRFGIRSFKFIFEGPGIFAFYIYMYILILTINFQYCKSKKENIFFIFLTIFSWICTLRMRGFIFILAYLISYWFIFIKNDKKLKLKNIIVIVAVSIPIALPNLNYYFGKMSKTARKSFLTNSIDIAQKKFPIGTGFATFGTDMAYKYYSKVYLEYGMEKVYGLSQGMGTFASDSYWPAILGECGVFGVILIIYLLYNLFFRMYKLSCNSKVHMLAFVFILVVTLGSSIATATFFHYTTVALMFILNLMYDERNEQKNA